MVGQGLGCPDTLYECVAGVPLVAMSNGQAKRQAGHGGTSGGFFVGDHLLMSVTPGGLVRGWLVGTADINEGWLLSAFLSARRGGAALVPPSPASQASR